MKHVMISELKAHLSAYLAVVRAGETVVVCDHKTPIARLEPIERSDDRLRIREPAIRDPEERARRLAAIKPVVHLNDAQAKAVQEILDDMRADRF